VRKDLLEILHQLDCLLSSQRIFFIARVFNSIGAAIGWAGIGILIGRVGEGRGQWGVGSLLRRGGWALVLGGGAG
jgi:hypothetical protein